MSAIGLGSRAIIGSFYKTLRANSGASWVDPLSMLFTSDQDAETYKWLGQSPSMREWVGGRNAKGFQENGLSITNKHYEATVEYLVRELNRDKTGQMLVRIRELAQRTNSHWASLLSTLILNGTSTVCYDGQFFFDTDHTEGNNTTSQSNDISTTIANLPAVAHGTTAAPSIEEAQQVMMKSVSQILSFKDNENEPMNEDAFNFMVMVPTSLYIAFAKALTLPKGTGVSEQHIPNEFNISVVTNPRLTGTTDFFTFRVDGEVKPFIRQQETDVQLKAKAEGSEFEFDNDAHQYGVDTWRNVGYGYWQHAVYHNMA